MRTRRRKPITRDQNRPRMEDLPLTALEHEIHVDLSAILNAYRTHISRRYSTPESTEHAPENLYAQKMAQLMGRGPNLDEATHFSAMADLLKEVTIKMAECGAATPTSEEIADRWSKFRAEKASARDYLAQRAVPDDPDDLSPSIESGIEEQPETAPPVPMTPRLAPPMRKR